MHGNHVITTYVEHESQANSNQKSCDDHHMLCVQQATAHGELLYQQVPTWCLKWNYRWPGLLAEIVHYKPDVMSLQEVDHFEELAARLEPLGWVDAWLHSVLSPRKLACLFCVAVF